MKQFFGKYRGLVIDNRDPELRGRIHPGITLPQVQNLREGPWEGPPR
jgi:hypothetical protein